MDSNLIQDLNLLKDLSKKWEILEFDEVIKDVSGGNKKIKKNNFLDSGEIPVIDQGKNLIGGYTNDDSSLVNSKSPHIIFGDHTRNLKFVNFPFSMGADGIKCLKLKNEKVVDYSYIFYFFQTLNIPNTGYNRHFKYLKKAKIPLPPLKTQQKIAAILDEADKLRRLNKNLIKKYEKLSQSLFLEMFGDPVSNPKGWEMLSTKELTLKVNKLSSNSERIEVEYVDISSINNINQQIESTSKFLFHKRPSRAQQILEPGDVLLSTVRPNLRNIAFIQKSNLIGSTGFYVFRLNEKMNNLFLFEMLKTESVTNAFVGITSGANYPALKNKDIQDFQFIVPPKEKQDLFAKSNNEIQKQKSQARQSLEHGEKLFNNLLQRAFKGELVKE